MMMNKLKADKLRLHKKKKKLVLKTKWNGEFIMINIVEVL